MKIHLFFGLCALICTCPTWAQPPGAWKLSKEADGIRIFSRRIPAENCNEMKADMIVHTSVEKLTALVRDASIGTRWIHRAKEFRLLEQPNDSTWYTYAVISIPFPFDDKDLVTLNQQQTLPGQAVCIRISSHPQYLPPVPGRSRIGRSESQWTFYPVGSDAVRVEYQVFAAQDGFLPAWIVIPLVAGGLHDTLDKMRQLTRNTP